jgi:hypothetical protein
MLTCSTLGRYGRFANGLFQIAGTIGIAMKRGYAFGFPEWKNHDHAERFGSTEDIEVQKYFKHPLPRFDGHLPDFPVSWGYHPHISIPDNVSISGHFQSEKYFKHCMGTVRHYFTMKDEPEKSDAVAIHWRLGDYDDRYHPRLTADYYIAALRAIGPVERATVYSDERDMAAGLCIRLEEETGIPCALSVGGSYLDDFRFMKKARHFITGNSSFSLMAAILGEAPDKKIVCPSNWFGPAWGQLPETKDLYPENAIVI